MLWFAFVDDVALFLIDWNSRIILSSKFWQLTPANLLTLDLAAAKVYIVRPNVPESVFNLPLRMQTNILILWQTCMGEGI